MMEILKQNDWAYLKEFFLSIEPWSEKKVTTERVDWIEISGVPFHYWNYETFKHLDSLWGELVSMRENTTKVNNFETM